MDDLYLISDKASGVRALQEALRSISRGDPRVRPVFVDGIYGPETRDAVADVQKAYGLPITGELDLTTSDLIFALRREQTERRTPRPYRPRFDTYEGNKMTPGDDFDDIYLLQLLLRELSIKDERFFVETSGRFDEQTEGQTDGN